MKRWCAEVTFEESRAHLGVETQRLHPTGDIPFQQAAWYRKRQATFTDVLAAVRRHLWNDFRYSTLPQNPDVILLPRSDLSRFADIVCSSA